MSTTAWSYSLGGEMFHGRFDTDAQAIDAGHEALFDHVESQGEEFADTELWVGEATGPATLGEFFRADTFLEDAMECAYGDYGEEPTEDWCPLDAPAEAIEQLATDVRALLDAWATKHDVEPRFWRVGRVRRIETDPSAVIREVAARDKQSIASEAGGEA